MDPHNFLVLAQQLAAGTTESAWRSAVSRAYYAAFHVAWLLLIDLHFRVPHANQAHGYLWLRRSNCSDPQVQQAGADLNDARRDRNWADYDLGRPMRLRVAQTDVQAAAQIIQRLETAAIEPTRSQITDAMKLYERDVLHDVTWHP